MFADFVFASVPDFHAKCTGYQMGPAAVDGATNADMCSRLWIATTITWPTRPLPQWMDVEIGDNFSQSANGGAYALSVAEFSTLTRKRINV